MTLAPGLAREKEGEMRHPTYLALLINKWGAKITVASVWGVRQCPTCGYKWAIVQQVPYQGPWQYDQKYQMLIVHPGDGVEISGACGEGYWGWLPTGRPHEFVALGNFELMPAQFPRKEIAWVTFRDQLIIFHEIAVIGDMKPELFPEAWAKECGRCFREALRNSPEYTQGNLYIKAGGRLACGALGAQTFWAGEEEVEVAFFNHTIRFHRGSLTIRGDIATLWLDYKGEAKITSPDHPGKDIVLTGFAHYDMYHPWPSRRRE